MRSDFIPLLARERKIRGEGRQRLTDHGKPRLLLHVVGNTDDAAQRVQHPGAVHARQGRYQFAFAEIAGGTEDDDIGGIRLFVPQRAFRCIVGHVPDCPFTFQLGHD